MNTMTFHLDTVLISIDSVCSVTVLQCLQSLIYSGLSDSVQLSQQAGETPETSPNFGETKRRLQMSPVQEEFQPAGQAADPQVQPRQAEDQRGLQPM